MAEVYLAIARGPGGFSKLQVLKLLKSDLTDQERADFAQMFQDEGRLAARLNHPNIVQSHEVGSQDGFDFIAMEYLEGQPLSRVQERSWPDESAFPLEMQLQVLWQVLEGLEYAHTLLDYDGTPLNIVHRDISPQNVFITYAGHVKLVDFGIAKTLESCKTRAGVVKGKVPYMSPEQVIAGTVDRRADLFSVGVMLWEAIARRSMHGTATIYEVLRRLVQGDLPKLRDVVPNVPVELERIVARALAPKPEDRFPDASSFRDELGEVMDRFPKVRARDMRERVTSLFEQERRDISEVIRHAMSEVEEHADAPGELASAHLIPTLPVLERSSRHSVPPPTTGTRPAPASAAVAQMSTAPPVGVDQGQSSGASPPASPRRRTFVLIAAGISALLGAVIFKSWNAGPAEPSPASHVSAPTNPPVAVPASSVRVRIRTVPENADLTLDGRVLPANPYDYPHSGDEKAHTLSVTAPGFRPRALALRFDRDVDIAVQLTAMDEAKAPLVTPLASHDAPNPEAPPPAVRTQPLPRGHALAPAPPKRDAESADPYGEFPKSKPALRSVPPLDTSEPW